MSLLPEDIHRSKVHAFDSKPLLVKISSVIPCGGRWILPSWNDLADCEVATAKQRAELHRVLSSDTARTLTYCQDACVF